MDKETVGVFIVKLLVAILFIVTYMYIEKLENTGCECSEHPNRSFVKNFSLFGATYYLLTMFVNPTTVSMDSSIAMLFGVVELVFLFMVGFYFYYTIDYIRYLINEKCKCSEDMRRELIMWGSIIELFLIVIVFLHAMIIPVVGSCTYSVLDSVGNTKKGISKAIRDPVSSLKEAPDNVSKTVKSAFSTSKKAFSKANKKLIN